MADDPDDLVLVQLRAIRGELGDIRGDLRELKVRQSETHSAVLSLRREQVQDAEVVAHL